VSVRVLPIEAPSLGDRSHLVHDGEVAVADPQRDIDRIGIDRPAAAATGDRRTWTGGEPLGSLPVADSAELTAARRQPQVATLDVRRAEEWALPHLAGALHVPLHDLPGRLRQVLGPPREVSVCCDIGYRASIAAGLLAGLTTHAVGVSR
jgi:hydroxyacylglutathione hydrolase